MTRHLAPLALALLFIFACNTQSKDHWQLAKNEYAARDFLGCILEINLYLENHAPSDSVLVLRAHCYNRVEKHEKAAKDLLHALQLNPTSLGAKLEFARLLAYQGDTLAALRHLTLPSTKQSGHIVSEFLLERALLLFYTKKPDESLQCLHQAIQADSTNPDAWFLRGAFYSSSLVDSLKNFLQPQQAVKDFEKAITLNPRYAEAYFKLAQTQLNILKDTLQGMKNLSYAIQLDSHNAGFYLVRAKWHILRKDFISARRDFNTVLNLNPLDSTAHAGLKQLQ